MDQVAAYWGASSYMPGTNTACPKHPRTGYFVGRGLFEGLGGFVDLEARIAELPVGDLGDAFEVFAEAYLATQKLVGAEARRSGSNRGASHLADRARRRSSDVTVTTSTFAVCITWSDGRGPRR